MFHKKNNLDLKIRQLIQKEKDRQKNSLEMIPSENFVSKEVLEAMGSVLTNKYSEGYPSKRYYGGNEYIDQIENLAIKRAKKLFNVAHANVQPYSGSPANLAVYLATCKPGDKIMGLNLSDGGHLTHGHKVSATGIFYKSIPYHVKKNGYLDFEEIEKLALKHKPKIIWCGTTAYPRKIDFKRFSQIAKKVNAYLIADISHIAGLIITDNHPRPEKYVHIITTTTHKTLRGPRGAMIMTTEVGLKKDPDLAKKLDKAVFPGLQGGPHNHTTAAIAVALKEASTKEFRSYAKQIIKNTQALAQAFKKEGLKLLTGGSDNHLILIDLSVYGIGKANLFQEALDLANITTNKNTISGEAGSAFYPSGLRLGTPAITTRNMKEKEMELIAKWIKIIIDEVKDYPWHFENKIKRQKELADFKKNIIKNHKIKAIKKEVLALTKKFPLYK